MMRRSPDTGFCSTVILAMSADAHYSYIACAKNPTIETIYPSPTQEPETRTPETPPAKSPSPNAASPTPSEPSEQYEPSDPSDPSEGSSDQSSDESSDGSSEGSEEPPTQFDTSNAASNEQDAKDTTEGSRNNTGAIIGGVIGGLALICISAVAGIYILRRNRTRTPNGAVEMPGDSALPAAQFGVFPAQKPVWAELDGERNQKPSELP